MESNVRLIMTALPPPFCRGKSVTGYPELCLTGSSPESSNDFQDDIRSSYHDSPIHAEIDRVRSESMNLFLIPNPHLRLTGALGSCDAALSETYLSSADTSPGKCIEIC